MPPAGPITSTVCTILAVVGFMGSPWIKDQLLSPPSPHGEVADVKVDLRGGDVTVEVEEVSQPPKETIADDTDSGDAAPEEQWSSATPQQSAEDTISSDATQSAGSPPESAAKAETSTTPAPETKKASDTKPATPPPETKKVSDTPASTKAKERSKFQEHAESAIHFIEVNAIAFDNWSNGPQYREWASGWMKARGLLPYIENGQKGASQFLERAGLNILSSAASSVILSWTLAFDYALFIGFVLWRLWKRVRSRESDDARQKKIKKMKEAAGHSPSNGNGNASPKASPKHGARSSPSPANSGSRNRNRNR